MKKIIIRFLSIVVFDCILLCGCQRDPIAERHNAIDALDVKSIEAQVEAMRETMALIKELQDNVPPILEGLENAQEELLARLEEIKAVQAASDSVSTEIQAQIISLQTQLSSLNAASEALAALDLQGRYEELEQFAGSSLADLESRTELLEISQQAFATLEQIAALDAAVKAAPEEFEKNFAASIEACREQIISWVAESDRIKALFSDYYTKDQYSFEVSVVVNTDEAQGELLNSLNGRLDALDIDIRNAIEKAFSDKKFDIDSEIGRINGELSVIGETVNNLTSRIEALEKLYGVIGDYSEYKSNLIDDIKAIQDKVLDEGTLTALVNTLKQLLVDGEGQYFDLKAIVARISAQKDSVSVHSVQLNTLDSLVRTLATIEALNSLNDDVIGLHNDMMGNRGDIATLVQRVDAIVAKWTDTIYDTIGANSEEIQKLREADLAIWEALGDTSTKDTGIYKLIADINTAIANWQIGDMRDSLTRINTLLANCGIGEIKGLQASLESLDARIAAIWTAIGNETLAISGSIINAINVLNSRFGNLGSATIEAIIAGLESDLAIIRGAGWDADSISLADLARICAKLKTDIGAKTDTSVVKDLKATVSEIQQTIVGIITEANADEKLAEYLKKTAADTLYATIENYDKFLGTYKKIVGEEADPAPGTVLYQIKFLGTLMGSGTFDSNWTTDLTTAVNRLHALVGQDSVSRQATDITNGLLQDLVNSILGGSGNVKDIADSLVSFRKNIDTLYAHIGDLSILKDIPDVATALECINEIVDHLKDNYAAFGHDHKDITLDSLLANQVITDFTEEVNKLLAVITGELGELHTTFKDNLVGAINELYDTFGRYHTGGNTDTLLTALELKLVQAVLGGDTSSFKDLNFAAIRRGIDDIIKDGTGILDSWVDSVITELYENTLKSLATDEWTAAFDYVSHSEIDTMYVTAMESLSGAFEKWGWTFNYSTLDSAVVMAKDSLAKYIVNYDNAVIEFNNLKGRVDAIESLIGGDGFFNASNTIKDVTDSLTRLFGILGGDGTTVESLVAALKSVDTLIINALLGKSSGGTLEDFENLNLKILKDRLDTLGFEDINTGGKSLVTSLQELADGISQLVSTIGPGYDSEHTLAESIKALSDSLGTFSQEQFDESMSSFQSILDELVDTLSYPGAGSLTSVAALRNRIEYIASAFDNILIKGRSRIDDILYNMDSTLDSLANILGDPDKLDEYMKKFGDTLSARTLVNAYDALRDTVEKYTFSGSILNNIGEIVDQMFDAARLKRMMGGDWGGIISQILFDYWDSELNTPSKNQLIAAVNDLVTLLNSIDMTVTNSVDPKQVDSLRAALFGEGPFDYASISALSSVLKAYSDAIGEKSQTYPYTGKTIWEAIADLYDIKDGFLEELGEQTGSSYSDLWTAIDDLKSKLLKSLGQYVNAIEFIPEYDDGCATLKSNSRRTTFGDLVMKFKVSCNPLFETMYAKETTNVTGVFKTSFGKDSNKDPLVSIAGDATFDSSANILTVTFSKNNIYSSGLQGKHQSSVSVVLCTGESVEFATDYIPVYYDVDYMPRIKSANPASGSTIKFAKGLGGSKKIILTPIYDDDDLDGIDNVCNIQNISVSGEKKERTVTASKSVTTSNTGTVSIKDDTQSFDYTIEIADPATDWTQTGASRSGTNLTIGTSKTVTIHFPFDEWNVEDGKKFTAEKTKSRNWVTSVSTSGNDVIVKSASGFFFPQTEVLKVTYNGVNIANITLIPDD